VADLGDDPIAVVGGALDQDRDAARPVALHREVLVGRALEVSVPFWIARLMLSAGMFEPLALSTAVRRRGLLSGSPPPMRAAMVISRMILVKSLPRLASSAPFLCLIECHLECPDMAVSWQRASGVARSGIPSACVRERVYTAQPALPGRGPKKKAPAMRTGP
jgi:hypothetical protein